MLDVIECAIHLSIEVLWILFGDSIPAAFFGQQILSLGYEVDEPWPDISILLSMRTAWL
jgi:hypothetical protein